MVSCYSLVFLMILLPFGCQSEPAPQAKGTTPPSHQAWDVLLKKWVDAEGMVNYKGFIQDTEKLQQYLDLLSNTPPDPQSWSEAEQLAYWINAYNAFTVKLIADNYPVKSIEDLHPTLNIPTVNTVWHKKFFKIGGRESSLDEIEHAILRKQFNEPRIHFAIVCASYSCPPLRREAYTAKALDKQLDEQARRFINDPSRNKIGGNSGELSKIFNWFEGDFTKSESLVAFLNRYANTKLSPKAKISYLEYDWRLNEQ
ncbi:MAG: DUF547 domain-containing protein [Bacteroidetes bacterium]|nr:DUF547 domain-containing protein [Bacteroidota bacterium]